MPTFNCRKLLLPALALLAASAAAVTACTYNAQKADILLHIEGLPANAVKATVTLTDNNNDTVPPYFPRFGATPGGPVDLAFAAPSAGTYSPSLFVQAFDQDDNLVGDGHVTSPGPVTFPADPPLQLALTLNSVSTDGSFGARCQVADGGVQTCLAGLICVQYQGSGSRGVCTQPCTGTCPSTPSPASQCLDNTGGGRACQWECDAADAGQAACPVGLVCGTQTGSSKKFCQPPP